MADNTREELQPYDMDWSELQRHIDIFDRIEVNYWDGDPRALQIEGGGVQVLRVTDISPTKTADKRVILHIMTEPFFFNGIRSKKPLSNWNPEDDPKVKELITKAQEQLLDEFYRVNNSAHFPKSNVIPHRNYVNKFIEAKRKAIRGENS